MSEQIDPNNQNELEQNFRQFTLETVPFDSLQIGDLITGLDTADDLQKFEAGIANFLSKRDRGHLSYASKDDWFAVNDTLEEQLRPARFLGKLLNGHAVVLPGTDYDEEKRLPNGRVDPYHRPKPVLKFWVQKDMYSGGRGKIGESSLIATYKRVGQYGRHNEPDSLHAFRIIKKAATKAQAERLINSLEWESTATHHAVAVIALGQTVSAGLPSLGKRR